MQGEAAKMDNKNVINLALSSEQNEFVAKALGGYNILVDACIGSGKTTAIQQLCNVFPSDRKILYLTYNRLLKLDAQAKIKNSNVTVTNYHGFAMGVLRKNRVICGVPEVISTFNRIKPPIAIYDILILDEYQDVEQEFADMLWYIKSTNPGLQLIAVGDMMQKIYDRTTLDVSGFINEFLGEHIELSFTKCFRLSAPLAAKLGRIWQKDIVGVNDNCIVEEMSLEAAIDFLVQQEPQDILCLGQRNQCLSDALNILEERCPEKFNKKTVYASIRDEDESVSKYKKNIAIFTTYDSSKGMERPICVVFDYTEDYWNNRIKHSQTSYDILRNIFCVAASRGKQHIIFVNNGEGILSEKSLCTREISQPVRVYRMSEMFQFKYNEDVEACYESLQIEQKKMSEDRSIIYIKNNDELIDLSPCIGIYQEAAFFGVRSLDAQIAEHIRCHPNEKYKLEKIRNATLEEKVLALTAMDTKQQRYQTQVAVPFVTEAERERICTRLSEQFSPDEDVQVLCEIGFLLSENDPKRYSAVGLADVVKDGIVYELKFVSELTHAHFLQCASYMIALNLETGILWNIRNNTAFKITIPDRKGFLDLMIKTITKRSVTKYYSPDIYKAMDRKQDKNIFALIDTETNFHDRIMSIGVVFADADSFQVVSTHYYILPDEAEVKGMYSNVLELEGITNAQHCERGKAVQEIHLLLRKYGVSHIFAYNMAFEKRHLQELSDFEWCDIMYLAVYKQFNPSIPEDAETYRSGRLKRGAGVEPILQRLRNDMNYHETHNALQDALDELEIMQRLGYSIEKYTSQSIQHTAANSKGKDTTPPEAHKTDISSTREANEPGENTSADTSKKTMQDIVRTLDAFRVKGEPKAWNPLIAEATPLKNYQEAHAALDKGKELLDEIKELASNVPTPDKVSVILNLLCESMMMQKLKGIPIESLTWNKNNIRVAILRNAGYINIWQVYKATYQDLLNISGIGPKNAGNIVEETQKIVESVKATFDIKPRFTRVPINEQLINEYCKYKWMMKIYNTTLNIFATEEHFLEECCATAAPAENIFRWLIACMFNKKKMALQAAAVLQERTTHITRELVDMIKGLYVRCSMISLEDSWKDYMEAPEEYEEWLSKRGQKYYNN